MAPMPLYRLDRVYSIRATATSTYVSAELGYPIGVYGLLRARATTVHDWEKFYVAASIGPGGVAVNPYSFLSAANNRFVKTDPRLPVAPPGAFDGMLRASAVPGSEDDPTGELVFDLVPIGPQDVALRCANGLFVSAELGYTGANYGMLRCRATTVGAWERFDIRVVGPAPPPF